MAIKQRQHYKPRDLWLEWLPYDVARPQQILQDKPGLICAGTDQYTMDDQVRCTYRARVSAHVRDHVGKGEGEFPLCGTHARRRGLFVVPGARMG